eukprot:TRINITY_DN10818_c0_g1_i4.p1 TRINITY_DN10818_c0_g1~~TRINITY_DN10818_c0_g1_i4.p1  ORF type:complete len:256 (+),score=-22.22 TRINITY_DN10818_c0_g1_i4:55-822(+)
MATYRVYDLARSTAILAQNTKIAPIRAIGLRINPGKTPANVRIGMTSRPRECHVTVASSSSAGGVEGAATTNTIPSPAVLSLWRTADAVCFDVDSTVCVDEGIDELAAYCGAGDAVAAWTTKAMSGSVPFEVALAARLDIIKPAAADLAGFLRDHPPRLNPGIEELVKRIKSRGGEVYLISGGFRQMIEPVASILGIPFTNIFANRILFHDEDGGDGSYCGFDESEPTSRSGGKAAAIAQLKAVRSGWGVGACGI